MKASHATLTAALAAACHVTAGAGDVRAQVCERRERSQLAATDGTAGDWFGSAVAISGDRAVIGAPNADDLCPTDPGCNSGAAYVFRSDGLTWVEEAKLIASDAAANDRFGLSVGIDGDRIVVGAPNDGNSGEPFVITGPGAAYVFRRSGTTWLQEDKLTVTDIPPQTGLGLSVSIWQSRVLLGRPGTVFVFGANGSDWSEEIRLAPFDSVTNFFGRSVSIGQNVALVGAPNDADACGGDPFCNAGAAYVFRFNGFVWQQETKLIALDASAGDTFGQSVSLSGDYAVVAAPRDDDACIEPLADDCDSGSVYVFRFGGFLWTETDKLTSFDASSGDLFGQGLSIDGDVVSVGAVDDGDAGTSSGSAYLFRRDDSGSPTDPSDDVWLSEAKYRAAQPAARDLFGCCVSISGDRVIVGGLGVDAGPLPEDRIADAGAAFIFPIDEACPNLAGYATFQNCFAGLFGGVAPGCEVHNLTADNDVDLDDLQPFLDAYTGP